MKIVIYISLCLILFGGNCIVYPDTPGTGFVSQPVIDSLKAKIKMLEDENSDEFSKRVDRQVEAKLWDFAKNWGAILGILFGPLVALLGFLGYKSGTNYLQEFIKGRIKEQTDKTIEAKVIDMVNIEYSKTAREQNILLLEYQLEKISIRADQSGDYSKGLIELESKFKNALLTEEKPLISKYLDELIRISFKTSENDKIASLIETYDGIYQFSYISWANAAITFIDLYESCGTTATVYRDWVLKGIDNSLKLMPGYGTGLAIKLVLLAIDYVNASDEKQKTECKSKIIDLLTQINSGSDLVTPYNTYRYLNLEYPRKRYAKYLTEVQTIAPELFAEMIRKYHQVEKG